MSNERFHTAYGLCSAELLACSHTVGFSGLPGDHGEASTGHNCNAAVANLNSIASNCC